MPERNDEDEEQLADRVLLQTWREWRRGVTREEAEAEAVAARESSPIFAGVAQPTSTGSSKAKSDGARLRMVYVAVYVAQRKSTFWKSLENSRKFSDFLRHKSRRYESPREDIMLFYQ